MKSSSIFEYRDYRKYLQQYLFSKPHGGHGEKAKIAKGIRCHSAYFSQILSGKSDLSLEQAYDFTEYAGLTPEEAEYFLLLVQLARAGTTKLRTLFQEKINQTEQRRLDLKNRLSFKKSLGKEEQATYFSSWYYSVIHLMISTLKGFQTEEEIKSVLALPSKTIHEVIIFLERAGLIKKVEGRYQTGNVDIHLGSDSAMLLTHHTNWRMQAIRALERQDIAELHYSSVVTIHYKDFEKIRKLLVESIEAVRRTVNESKSEDTVSALTLDWFMLTK